MDRLRRFIEARLGARHGVLRSVGTLVRGTAIAQALALLALPILTRLYSPADFSVLAVYASLLGIFAVVACLRLELAIPLPERDEDAANLLALSLCFSFIVSLLVGLGVLLLPSQAIPPLGLQALEPYLWMVPVGVWIASAFSAIQYWSTRKMKFQKIARTRVVQALGGVGVQVSAGAIIASPIGLLLGHMISGGAGFIGLARDAWRADKAAIGHVSVYAMRQMLQQYSRFPKFSTFEALGNTAGIQIPIIIIAAWAIGPEAGYLMLAIRVMAAPMSLVGGSVSQVYLAHAPVHLREGTLGTFSAKVLGGLAKAGFGPLLFAGIVAEPAFAIVFGEEWQRAGELVAWMTPWFLLQFASSPVSMVMHVSGRQEAMLAVTTFGLVLRVGAMWVAFRFAREHFSEIYAVSGAIFYGACVLVFYRVAGVSVGPALVELRRAAPVILGWGASGWLLRILLEIDQ